MLLQTKIKNKKGVSLMIGYILLVSIAIVMGGIIYVWLKTYVPAEALECPDDVSLYIENLACQENPTQPNNYNLTLNIKNNGLFNVGGFYIHATKNPEEELATLDLSQNLTKKGDGIKGLNSVLFVLGNENSFGIDDEMNPVFDFENKIYSVEIIPIRFQEYDNKIRFVSCGDAKIKQEVDCGGQGNPTD